MLERDLAAWLAFSFTPQLGIRTLQRLASRYALSDLKQHLNRDGLAVGLKDNQIQYLQRQADQDVDACLRWSDQADNRHILTPFHAHYPSLLTEIAAAPPVLFVEGRLEALRAPQIAIVGSRNASIDSQQIAHQFATQLVEHGLVVTSGLALGIDGYAHDGALKAGGETIAVLGSGLECIYPARHRALAGRIVDRGALVSEFRPDAKPRPDHFPRRNRIISGLSLGVLVVEAAENSGSLITARYAAEQSREVFVVPGSIRNPNSLGSNQLIRQGACLVQHVDHILEEVSSLMDWSRNQSQPEQTELFSGTYNEEELPFPELLANVGGEATPVDILANRTNIPVQDVMMQLLELELSGHVVAVSGGYIRKGRG
ncbi:DNA-processing protein DprA [Vibrio fluvialis]|nr:DNA-processing protein DprA [Vibrio fluvialis]MBY7941683.1 DNA-processing protein DprA [Vibrio fluvialis]MBY8169007.1 DNA-processing protein DprA [Vibrio fluvialis]MBY8258813.1 DNA-processing protein DprA [Vibrio fluvialis]MBY8267273.1 DNA-processing protein DprA [Vibrio fluvialis]